MGFKKTKYFASDYGNKTKSPLHIDEIIKSAEYKRDLWLSDNKSDIHKVDEEDIQIVPYVNNNIAFMLVVIRVTYYEKI